MNLCDIAWAAGLFEGEGCISVRSRTSRKGSPFVEARLLLDTTDEDVVRRFAAVVGGTVHGPFDKAGGRKPVWMWHVTSRAEAQRVLGLFRPYLGARRAAKADVVLALGPSHPRQVLGLSA